MYVPLMDGKKISMPRYYKDRLYDTHEREAIGWLQLQKMRGKLDDYIKNDPDYFRNREQAVLASFERMKEKQKQRNKI